MTAKNTSVFRAASEHARPLVIAHRGGSLEAPENTLAAIAQSVRAGSDWQEVDVGLSADEQCVVLHDDSVARTTDGEGNLDTLMYADLMRLRAGRPRWDTEVMEVMRALGVTHVPDFGDTFSQERVPSLAQVLAVPDVRLMIELKTTPKPEVLVTKVLDAVHRAQMGHRVALGSFDPVLMEHIARLAPRLPRLGICEDVALFDRLLGLQVSALAVYTGMLDAARAAVPPGVAVWTWTVYTTDVARTLTQNGADGLITDIPQAVLKARALGALGR